MARPVALPLIVSVLLHLAVVVLLAFNLTFSSPPQIVQQPKIIEAKLVSLEQLPALRAKPQPVTQAEPTPVEVATPEPEPEKPEPVKPEPPRPNPPNPEKQRELEKQIQVEKEKAELQQKKIAEQKKQDAERKRKEAEEVQRKKQQETQQKTAEELARKKREQQEKNELAKAMAAEDNAMAAERDQEAVASYSGMIQRDVQNNWSRPPSARIGMRVTLLIQLIPSGDVMNVSVLKSSGNEAFDQSAISAVRRVGKFAYMKELSDKSLATFDNKFRRFILEFTPEDLRQ